MVSTTYTPFSERAYAFGFHDTDTTTPADTTSIRSDYDEKIPIQGPISRLYPDSYVPEGSIHCVNCNKRHLGRCKEYRRTCWTCREIGHVCRFCPNKPRDSRSRSSVQDEDMRVVRQRLFELGIDTKPELLAAIREEIRRLPEKPLWVNEHCVYHGREEYRYAQQGRRGWSRSRSRTPVVRRRQQRYRSRSPIDRRDKYDHGDASECAFSDGLPQYTRKAERSSDQTTLAGELDLLALDSDDYCSLKNAALTKEAPLKPINEYHRALHVGVNASKEEILAAYEEKMIDLGLYRGRILPFDERRLDEEVEWGKKVSYLTMALRMLLESKHA